MRHSLIKAVVIISLIGAGQTAQAQGIRLGGTVSQGFSLDDNGSGYNFDSVTSVGASLSTRTRNSSLSVSSGISMVVDDQNGVQISRPRLRFSFGHATKDVQYSGGFSLSRGPASVDVLQPDLSVLTYTGERTSFTGNLNAAYALNARSGLTVGLSAGRTDFDPVSAGLVPSNTFGLQLGYNTRLTPVTSMGLNASVGLFQAENTSDTTSVSAGLGGSVTHQLDKLTSVSGNLGLSFVETTDTVAGVESSNFTLSGLFGAGVTRSLPDGSIGLRLSQSVVPGNGGSLLLDTSLSGSYSYQVNRAESLGVSMSVNRQQNVGGGQTVTFVGISPTYSRQLTRDINANASAYLQQDDQGNTSHGINVSISRAFDFGLF